MISCHTLENRKMPLPCKRPGIFSPIPVFMLSLSYHMPIYKLGKVSEIRAGD